MSSALPNDSTGPTRNLSRRRFIQGGAATGAGAIAAVNLAPRYAFGQTAADLLVVVFLRGGFDGLSAVVPVNDGNYYRARPNIGVPASQTVNLNGGSYRLNRHLSALAPLFAAGDMVIGLGAGTPWISRSHFEDMNTWEWGNRTGLPSGWLGRHLATSSAVQGTFRAITHGDRAVLSLSHPNFQTLAIPGIDDFDLWGWDGDRSKTIVSGMLDRMHREAGGMVAAQARTTFDAISGLASVRADTSYAPENGAVYPTGSQFGRGLAEVAQLAKAGKGLEVACVDFGGWDMHQNLGKAINNGDWFSRKSRELAQSLAAFATDLGARWANTTVVVMSEFGRRVQENGDLGVDHGTGNTMFLLGGSLNGSKVVGRIPALSSGNLYRGDVPVALDYRQVLSEVVAHRLGNGAGLPTIFPGYRSPGSLRLYA